MKYGKRQLPKKYNYLERSNNIQKKRKNERKRRKKEKQKKNDGGERNREAAVEGLIKY